MHLEGYPRRMLPSLLLVSAQALSFALVSACGFWVFSDNYKKLGFRTAIAMLSLLNCGTSRYLASGAAAALSWLGVALNFVSLGLCARVVHHACATSSSGCDKPDHIFFPHPNEYQFAIFILSLIVITTILQLAFKVVASRSAGSQSLFSLFSGDLTLDIVSEEQLLDHHEADTLLPINNNRSSSLQGTGLIHTQCRVEVIPAWFMRILSVLIILSGTLMFLLGVGVAISSSESKDQYYLDGTSAITIIYVQNGAVQWLFALVALFVSVRFSSRRRLLVVIAAAIMVVITSIVHFGQVMHIKHMILHGEQVPGFLFVGATFTTLWALSATWALKYKNLFDNSVMCCFKCKVQE